MDMLDAQPAVVQRLMGALLCPGQLGVAGCLGGHEDRHVGKREGQKAQILHQPTPGREGVKCHVGHGRIMHAAARGVTENEDRAQRVDQQDIVSRMIFCLAALTLGLCRRGLGADDASLGAVMGTRGDAGTTAAAGDVTSAVSGATTVAASASETPSRCARAIRERAGASPRVRRATSKAGKRMWIHGLA